jgi:formate dehydrogenase subunit gamma
MSHFTFTALRGWGVALSLAAGLSLAQAQATKADPLPDDLVAPASATAVGGVKSANIFEIAPDASADPNYAGQTNAERRQVQPGNNAPMWRDVGKGVTGYSSLPVSQAPEAGNLIQPFVQYPGSRLTTAGEAWRQVRNDWLIPYGGALLFIV